MIRVERAAAAAVVTIARPEAKNALDEATMAALQAFFDDAAKDASLRAVVLTGQGDAFVSGADLRELSGKHTAAHAALFAAAGYRLCAAIAALPVPVIAALPGVAFGGGAELAVACDLRVAETRARVSFKQARMGVTTAWGTLGRLVALVGAGAAARLLLTAAEVGAVDAQAMGLVDTVCADGGAVPTALAWADEIAKGAPDAVRRLKALVRMATAAPPVLDAEREAFCATWPSADHVEAVEAYFARRAPRWGGKPG